MGDETTQPAAEASSRRVDALEQQVAVLERRVDVLEEAKYGGAGDSHEAAGGAVAPSEGTLPGGAQPDAAAEAAASAWAAGGAA